MFLRFVMFGILGILWEVAFGAAKGILFQRNFDLRGSSSLWMFPIYGLLAFIYPLIAHQVGGLAWWGRGIVYMLAFFLGEYLVGKALARFNIRPWNYSGKYTIGGFIYLPYAPVWFLLGLAIEWIYPWIVAYSQV